MYNFENAKRDLAAAAKKNNLDKYEIYYEEETDIEAETLKNELSGFSSSTDGGISFRCIVGGKAGFASTQLFEKEEMYELVSRAVANAGVIDSESVEIIFGGSEKYGEKTKREYEETSVAEIKERALEIQKSNYAHGEYVADGTQSGVTVFENVTRLCNSEGLDLSNRTFGKGMYTQIVINKGGEPSYGFEFTCGTDPSVIPEMTEKAYAEATEKLGAGMVKTGAYDIVISGKMMINILSAFWSVFSARSVRLGQSLLSGKTGEKIAADCVSITDDPFNPECPVQTTFDGEGVAVYKKSVIENGVLKTFLYNLSEAARANKETTANGYRSGYSGKIGISPYCFSIEPGKDSLDELFKAAGNGIYITEMKGLHAGADDCTGDFSIESSGFLIENGLRTKPVKSFTIAGNFYDLLKSIERLENKVEYGIPLSLNVFASPSALVRGISVAGQ